MRNLRNRIYYGLLYPWAVKAKDQLAFNKRLDMINFLDALLAKVF